MTDQLAEWKEACAKTDKVLDKMLLSERERIEQSISGLPGFDYDDAYRFIGAIWMRLIRVYGDDLNYDVDAAFVRLRNKLGDV